MRQLGCSSCVQRPCFYNIRVVNAYVKDTMTLDLALSIVLIVSASCYLLLGAGIIAINKGVGALPIGVLFIVISVWVIGGAIE